MKYRTEQLKYGLLRRIDHYKTKFDYKLHDKETNGFLSVAFRRYEGPRDNTGNPIHPLWDRQNGKWIREPAEFTPFIYVAKNKNNLLTNGGRDFIHNQSYVNTSGGLANGANFIALSNDGTAPAPTDTVVATEITTNGLARIQSGTITHSAGTNTSQFINTWTCATAPQASVKAGTLTALSVGTLVHENTYTSVSLQIGDQIQITWTFTLG